MLSFPPHRQDTLTPVWRHHNDTRAALYFLDEAAVLIIPIQISIAITDYNISIVHDLEGSGLKIELKLIQIAVESNFILVNWVIFANRKECITNGMKQTSSNCCIIVKIYLSNKLFRMRIPQFYSVMYVKRTAQN